MRTAWMGYPTQLKEVLSKILNNTWDMKQAHEKRAEDLYLAALDDSLNWEFFNYKEDRSGLHRWPGKPDSALLLVNKFVSKEPRLKYAPHMAINTLEALIKTNVHDAYEYAKALMATPNYNVVYNTIDYYKDELNLPVEMCELGAKACQQRIDQSVLPEIDDLSYYYNKMAGLYWSAKNKSKAIESAQKAIELLKVGKFYSRDLAVYKARLQQYRNM